VQPGDALLWPRWYRQTDGLGDWADPDVLLALGRKGDAVDHFAVRLALAGDETLRAQPGEGAALQNR
jgi:hypothetical protein